MVAILLRVVGKERRAIVTERPTVGGVEHNSESDQVVLGNQLVLNDDIIDWTSCEPEHDRFNKISVMSGLKFLARKMHSLPDEEAVHILDNLQWLPIALAQFRACDYVIEEVDELVCILLEVSPT